ncbi:MAG TPA: diacylglycerol kinase family protein [Beutenbergiaceae bacterium]|nr:diacylglycerol kinase family protein [Beutenbergiaceae bacterium]
MRWELVLSVAAFVLALIAVVIGVMVYQRVKPAAAPEKEPSPAPEAAQPDAEKSGPPAFVVNPTKVSLPAFRKKAEAIAAGLGLPAPLWWETTLADPGTGQALDAVAHGASTVVAVGGDGTVRSVAAALQDTGVPMGLVPKGTGNLFARNLDLPIVSTSRLIETALTAAIHPVDIGWVRPDGPDPDLPEATPFLVISGVGFDAAMVADADDELKARLGWLAYFFAGARHLHGKKFRVRLTLDSGDPISRRVRSMLVANVGRLPGGFVLFPDAEADDGMLDLASIDTRMSVVGWLSLLGTVVLQGVGIRIRKPRPTSDLEFWRGSAAEIRVDQPSKLQVDGDIVGPITSATFTVNPGGLLMRFEPPNER